MDVAFASVAEGLAGPGFVIFQGCWPECEVASLRRQAGAGFEEGEFHPAGVGRAAELAVRAHVRRDLVRWLEPADPDPAVAAWWLFLETLRCELNRRLFLSLAEAESHFAGYPEGAFYRRHLDRFRDDGARMISCVLYLNDAWSKDDGGLLRLYPPAGGEGIDVVPSGGTLVVFRSDTVEHEVLTAHRRRISVAGWLRRRSAVGSVG